MLLKITSEGQRNQASNSWPPRKTALEIHPLSLGKTYVEIKAILHRSDRFASCILLRVYNYKIDKLQHLWPKKMLKGELRSVFERTLSNSF